LGIPQKGNSKKDSKSVEPFVKKQGGTGEDNRRKG